MRLRNLTTIYVFNSINQVLLMERRGSRVFKGTIWSGIGGHFEKEEMNQPRQCILRELEEETGLLPGDISSLKLKYITTRLAKSEIRQQYIYFANINDDDKAIMPCDEGLMEWVDIDQLFARKLSVTNRGALKHYFNTGIIDAFIYVGLPYIEDNVPVMKFTKMQAYSTRY